MDRREAPVREAYDAIAGIWGRERFSRPQLPRARVASPSALLVQGDFAQMAFAATSFDGVIARATRHSSCFAPRDSLWLLR
jgi:hypothetical protein